MKSLPVRVRVGGAAFAMLLLLMPAMQSPATAATASSRPAPSQPEHRSHFRPATALEIRAAHLRPGVGVCAGAYESDDAPAGDPDKTCTHGPDVYDATAAATDLAAASTSGPSASSIPCYGTGPYVRVLYLYSGTSYLDASNPHAQRPLIREAIGLADKLFVDAAASSSKVRHVHWKMSSCKLTITAYKTDTTASIFTIRQRLINAGRLGTSEKGLAFIEGNGCSGLGEVRSDDRASSSNPSNGGGMLAILGTGCFASRGQSNTAGAQVAAHELLHTLGAVQLSAPHSTGAYHCTDEWDTMCYADGGPKNSMTHPCALKDPEILDCGKNDYFNAAPKSGSYLATHWNTARSRFLATYGTSNLDTLARPSVSITAPVKNGIVSGKYTIKASASAPSGSTLKYVEFYVGGTLIATDTTSPYTATLETRFDGFGGYRGRTALTFKARAVDSYYRTKTSTSVPATVDNPTVRLTSPGSFEAVSGLASWSASAHAPSGRTVDRVYLYVNNAWNTTDTTAPYGGTFDTSPYANGASLQLKVVVKDSAGVTRSSVNRTVSVRRPEATLVQTYSNASGPLRLAATAEAPPGTSVAHVDFFVNNALVESVAGAPYVTTWNPGTAATTPDGSYDVTAIAYDSSGTAGVSSLGSVSLIRTSDSVAVSSPGDGDLLSGASAPLSTNVSLGDPANWTVYGVNFIVDDISVGSGTEGTPGTYTSTLDTTALTNGPHILQASLDAYNNDTFDFVTTYSQGTLIDVENPGAGIAFTTPASGATVKGAAIPVGATVSGVSAGDVNQVQFMANEHFVDAAYDSPYAVAWDSTQFADGPVTLSADAFISTVYSYNEALTTRVVNLANTTAKITSPSSGSTISGTRTLTASTTKDVETVIEWVRFYVDGSNRCHDGTASSTGSYSCSWSTTGVSNGTHTIVAKISTTDGRTISSPSVTVTVSN